MKVVLFIISIFFGAYIFLNEIETIHFRNQIDELRTEISMIKNTLKIRE